MIGEAAILPTGEEIRSGIVTDTDSPEVMAQLVKAFPLCAVRRLPPLPDDAAVIREAIRAEARRRADVIILIGGSGGGHRYDRRLGKDFTHTAMEAALSPRSSRELYGRNGHLWCKLVCGLAAPGSLVLNLPGPFVEARAACAAVVAALSADGWTPPADEASCGLFLDPITQAVAACYG